MISKRDKARNQRLYKTYGITLEEFNQKLENQDNGCWICGRTEGRLCQDHRHIKGYKHMTPEEKKQECRAVLCFLCNTMLHGIEKRLNARFLLGRMVEYFKIYKIKGDV